MAEHTPKLLDALDAFEDGIYIINEDYTVEYMNRFMKELFGEGVGKKCYQVYHRREEPCPWCPTLKTIASGKPSRAVVPYPFKMNGWVDLTSFPLQNEDGEIQGVIEYVKDITLQREAEEERARLQVKLMQFAYYKIVLR